MPEARLKFICIIRANYTRAGFDPAVTIFSLLLVWDKQVVVSHRLDYLVF